MASGCRFGCFAVSIFRNYPFSGPANKQQLVVVISGNPATDALEMQDATRGHPISIASSCRQQQQLSFLPLFCHLGLKVKADAKNLLMMARKGEEKVLAEIAGIALP